MVWWVREADADRCRRPSGRPAVGQLHQGQHHALGRLVDRHALDAVLQLQALPDQVLRERQRPGAARARSAARFRRALQDIRPRCPEPRPTPRDRGRRSAHDSPNRPSAQTIRPMVWQPSSAVVADLDATQNHHVEWSIGMIAGRISRAPWRIPAGFARQIGQRIFDGTNVHRLVTRLNGSTSLPTDFVALEDGLGVFRD